MAEIASSPFRGLGGMQVIPLSEGTFTIDKTKLFIPFDDEFHDLQQRPVGSLLVEIQPFIIITSKDILLLDTGLGFVRKDSFGEKVQKDQLIGSIASNLLQTKSGVSSELIKQYADAGSKESFIKTATLQLMSTPEYQLC